MTYVNAFSRLYLVDNSPISKEKVSLASLTMHDNISYINMEGNKGIATALNQSLTAARADGYPYLMTMDQDSQFEAVELNRYLYEAERVFSEDVLVGVLGIYNNKEPHRSPKVHQETTEIITSGMIIDANKAKEIGGFCDKLFIDFVDFEFCYRMQQHGYKCEKVNNCCLTHQIGNNPPIYRLGIRINNQNIHSPVRFYYEFRNSLYVIQHYPQNVWFVVLDRIKVLVKIILVEHDKIKKLAYSLRGVYDALRDRYGEYTPLNHR